MDNISHRVGKRIYIFKDGAFSLLDEYRHSYKCPETLYKYFPLSHYSVEALTKGYVYAANPIDENDLYDSTPLLINSKSTGIFTYINKYNECKSEYSNTNTEYKKLGDVVFSKYGILSTTNDYKNELMWAHYAHHSGFCLSFDTQKFAPMGLIGFYPVQYRKLISLLIAERQSELIPYLMCLQKSPLWKNEKEWRGIFDITNIPNRECYYDQKKGIKAIHFGYNFFDMTRREDPYKYYFDNVKANIPDRDALLNCKKKILKFVIQNTQITPYINFTLKLNKFFYKKCKITKIDPENNYITIEHITSTR